MMLMKWQKLKTLGTLLIATLLLSCIALYNGYPLVYPDSGSYIGLQGNLLRSFFYNIFISPALWFQSLWLVVVVQSLIIAHLLQLVLRVVFQLTSSRIFLAVTVFLCLLTNLPWFTGFIMPDIFTGILILSLFLLIFCGERLSRSEKNYLFFLTVLAVTVHFSHIPFALGLIMSVCLLRMMKWKRMVLPPMHLGRAGFALVLALVLLLAKGYISHGVFTISPGSYSFQLARLVADGPAVLYLREHCPEKKYALCSYLDELPADSDEFLWALDSPFRKVGWIDGYRLEGQAIVKETILHHPFLVIQTALRNAGRQLFMINNCYGICSYLKYPHPTDAIRSHFPGDFSAYESSRQSQNGLGLKKFNHLHKIVLGLSLLGAVAVFYLFLKRHQYLLTLCLISIVFAYFLSSFITGILSAPHNRYGSRIIWLLPFFSIASLIHIIKYWKNYAWILPQVRKSEKER
jgi:hypothetical protein